MYISQIRDDLLQEQQALDTIVANLSEEQWQLPTASPGWTVADQISHLSFFDATAVIAITDPEAFKVLVSELSALTNSSDLDDYSLKEYRGLDPSDLLSEWRSRRIALAAASGGLRDDDRVFWYGPSMGAKSFLTARMMEVWAHGQDVVDTIGVQRNPTDRLRHIVKLGYITRDWAYINRGLVPLEGPVHVTLKSPSGEFWKFGTENEDNQIDGSALDFCLVVTQRRTVNDTDLRVSGEAATSWLSIAQAFAGPPTTGPQINTG